MAISFKGRHYPREIILCSVRWYVAYALSYRNLEEMLSERGLAPDHSTIQRWVTKYSPQLEAEFRERKKQVGKSWRMDETYIRVSGKWYYLYRAVDKEGKTIDFMLSEHRDKEAALRFFNKAIGQHGNPDTVNIDKSGANTSALDHINALYWFAGLCFMVIVVRQNKYLNNIIEQDHRSAKRPMKISTGFKSLALLQFD